MPEWIDGVKLMWFAIGVLLGAEIAMLLMVTCRGPARRRPAAADDKAGADAPK
jgi:hypothetical protein